MPSVLYSTYIKGSGTFSHSSCYAGSNSTTSTIETPSTTETPSTMETPSSLNGLFLGAVIILLAVIFVLICLIVLISIGVCCFKVRRKRCMEIKMNSSMDSHTSEANLNSPGHIEVIETATTIENSAPVADQQISTLQSSDNEKRLSKHTSIDSDPGYEKVEEVKSVKLPSLFEKIEENDHTGNPPDQVPKTGSIEFNQACHTSGDLLDPSTNSHASGSIEPYSIVQAKAEVEVPDIVYSSPPKPNGWRGKDVLSSEQFNLEDSIGYEIARTPTPLLSTSPNQSYGLLEMSSSPQGISNTADSAKSSKVQAIIKAMGEKTTSEILQTSNGLAIDRARAKSASDLKAKEQKISREVLHITPHGLNDRAKSSSEFPALANEDYEAVDIPSHHNNERFSGSLSESYEYVNPNDLGFFSPKPMKEVK